MVEADKSGIWMPTLTKDLFCAIYPSITKSNPRAFSAHHAKLQREYIKDLEKGTILLKKNLALNQQILLSISAQIWNNQA